MKKILVCCGSSMVTSTVALNNIKEACQKAGIDATFGQCKFAEVPFQIKTFNPDVIVPTGPLDESSAGGIPVVKGISFVTGVGIDKTIAEILDILKS